MRWHLRLLSTALVTGLLAATALAQGDPAAVAGKARDILKQHCSGCHNGKGSKSGYEFDVEREATLLAKIGDEDPVIVPKNLDESRIYARMNDKTMPPRTIKERPTKEDIEVVKKWIELGAPAFPPTSRKFRYVPHVEVLTAIATHLQKADRDDRSYLRYFTLTHLYNNPRIDEEDLRLFRAALAKAINSLSWRPGIVLPEAVDREQTVFVIDVRKLDWDRKNLWNEVLRHYPYGLHYRNHPDRNLQKVDDDICQLTGCELAYVRADWFIATATRPPLYHILLQIPKTGRELEYRLGVDIPANFMENKLVRAGFSKSGVSNQNRLLERHDANTGGSYWKSYDFKPESGRAKLSRFPLGPLNLFPPGKHPYSNQAFVHDGGEIIWGLPNGMQGYMLVDGKDERIDAGPIDVVSDEQRTSGTPAIVTGVSCMACHVHGMIPFTDTIRSGSAVFGEAERKVERLYADARTMNEFVDVDKRRFLDALEKTMGRFLRAGPGDKRSIVDFKKEPIGQLAKRYRNEYLDLKTVALELDLEKPEELVARVGERKMKQLGLEALLRKDGYISRLEWEANDGYSLMQEVAKELRATPVGP